MNTPSGMNAPSGTGSRIGSQERRALFSGVVGNSLEYYEFAVYGLAAALIFKDLFFSNVSSTAGTLLSLGTFAVAFIARPIGALVFGHFGDKLGRKGMLIVTLSLMGGATFCIGLLPTYDQIGIWAPLLLVVLRLLQGFSLGGEYGGSVLMAIEHAYPKRRGFFGSLVQSGIGWGTLLANLVFLGITQLPEDQLLSWGWRIPFLLSAVLVGVCMFIRLRLDESPEFEVAKEVDAVVKVPLGEVLRKHGWTVLGVALMIPGSGILYYVATVFSLTYASGAGINRDAILAGVLIVNIVLVVGIPTWGWLTDIVGRRVIWLASFIGMGVATWIWLPLLNTGTTGLIILGFIILFIPHTANNAALPATFAHAFPAKVRYSGLAVGYNFGTLIASALAPLIAAWLLESTGSWVSIALYISAANLVSFIAAIFTRERYGKPAQAAAVRSTDTADVVTVAR
ncbi:MFS transporter [Geodermatophilus sp. CPCC 205506]|uniref:MFS transporter n=1 Tax=Geodermatophilus sp. CPCC 205506 TaxID=2936596 RepID=UPI003EEF43C9